MSRRACVLLRPQYLSRRKTHLLNPDVALQRAIAAIALNFAVAGSSAQTDIDGAVADSLGKPVQWTAIGLLDARDSSVVKGTLTDDKGAFVFAGVKAGSYLVRVSSPTLGESLHGPFVKDSLSALHIPPIKVAGSANQLKEVEVSAVKDPIEFSNGNVTMNIEGTTLATGNTVLDLLSKMPGVMVEAETISIQGRSGVILYIDERQQQLSGLQLINFLRSLSASDVEKLEVIVNPPARYDAAGNAGIINIKMKRVKVTGFSGSANAALSQGFYLRENGGLSLNYKGKSLNIFTSLNGNNRVTHYVSRFDRTITTNGVDRLYNERTINDNVNRDMVANAAIDWYATKKYTFGAKFQGIPGHAMEHIRATTTVSDPYAGYSTLLSRREQPNDWYLANYNVNGERKLDTLGSYVRVSGDYYSPYFDNYFGTLENRYVDSTGRDALPQVNYKTENLLDLRILSTRSDAHVQVRKDYAVDAGVKSNWTRAGSDFSYLPQDNAGGILSDPSLNNVFIYNEHISAAYVSANGKNGKIDYNAGLRWENTDIHTSAAIGDISYTRNYSNLFPQAGVSLSGKGKHRLSFNYNRRIDRPNYNSFNPYRWFTSPLTGGTGNPYLFPALSDNFSLNYGYGSEMNHSLSFTSITHPILGYMAQDDATGTIIWRVANFRRLTIARCNLFFKKQIYKWWTTSLLVGAYYISYSGDLEGSEVFQSKVPHYEWLSSTFLLPRNYKIELTAFYWGPWLGIGFENIQRGGLNAGIKKTMLNNNLTLSLSVNDVFFTEPFRSRANFRNQRWTKFDSNDTRRVNIGISYNFGRIKAEQRQIEEEKARVGK